MKHGYGRVLLLVLFAIFLSVNSFCAEEPVSLYEDLRGIDLTNLDLRNVDLVKTTFDSFTKWPPSDMIPLGFDAVAVMEWGKIPGLGIKRLHQQGITGNGVHVAIIDQPLLPNHVEYKGKLFSYTEIQTGNAGPQMHGPAVASLLVGKTCGVAPGAILHYWAEPSWKRDYQYRCTALEQILQYNQEKPLPEQIRIVSVSKGFSVDEPDLDRWKQLLERAKQQGIYVIHCSRNMFGVGCPVYKDREAQENYQLCSFYNEPVFSRPGYLFAPVDNRTTASWQRENAYIFWSQGGLSWGAPFIAGVAALGLQVKPNLSEKQIEESLYQTGWDFQQGKLINPEAFARSVRGI